jgi:signal transduction histidine kinase
VPPKPSKSSPTAGLLIGLILTLAAVVVYSVYITAQVRGLRQLQNELGDRNRKDSLQLLRIQNDLNSLALAMRDMLDADEPYPLAAWSAQFERIRGDLDDALQKEESFAVVESSVEQRTFLRSSMQQFWDASERIFALARTGHEREARDQIRLSLQARLAALSTSVARLLVQNNETEQQASVRVGRIYERVQNRVYLFLTATLLAITLTSFYVIRANRRFFSRLAELSGQRRELAQKLISTQESTLLNISRELHDEFGQVLTAMGTMLKRAEKHAPEGSTLRTDLVEIEGIAQSSLNSVRGLSQALHPVMLEEAGLERTIEWYLPMFQRQTGIQVSYVKSGSDFAAEGSDNVHIYRILQEALNNVVKHSEAKEAWVRAMALPDTLQLEVEDHGGGFAPKPGHRGIGLVAMRERAGLMGGVLSIEKPEAGGTKVRLVVPKIKQEPHV